MIKNASDFSDETVKEVVKFCMPDNVNGVKIIVKNGNGYSHSWNTEKKIEVMISKHGQSKYPCIRHPHQRYKWTQNFYNYDGDEYYYSELVPYKSTLRHPVLILSRIEELVEITAHELRHQWQRRRPLKNQWTFGNRGKTTKITKEHDACQYAMMKVRQWRKLHSYDALYLTPYLDKELIITTPDTTSRRINDAAYVKQHGGYATKVIWKLYGDEWKEISIIHSDLPELSQS